MSQSATTQSTNQMTGVLKEKSDDHVVIAIPETSYEISLSIYKLVDTPVGKRITGTVRAQAMRIDVVNTGGKYLEPVFGRPRRIQGRIRAIDASERTVTIDAGVPVVCKTDVNQNPTQFTVGDFVTCGVHPGASFTVAS